jgi:hypothetical protein
MILTEEIYKARKYEPIVLIIPSLLFLPVAFSMPRAERQPVYFWGPAFLLALGLFFYFRARRTQIRISDNGITYGTPRRNCRIHWEEIDAARVQFIPVGSSFSFELVLEGSGNTSMMAIPAATFSRAALRAIASALLRVAPHVQCDERIRNFAAGKFPWYIR